MKRFRYWKIALGLVLVFVAGAVTGSLATHYFIRQAFEQNSKFENWTAHATAFLRKELKLTPEQQQKIQAIFEESGPEFKAVFARTLDEGGRVLVQTQRRIDQELTPEQRAIHAELKKKLRTDLKKKFNFDLPEE